ncbi:MAG: hypothetical protein WAN12_02845 [Candidatus Acidiferrum sp.]
MLDMLAWRVRDVQGNRASVAVDSMNSSTPKERIESWRDRTGAVTVRITGIVEARMEPEGTVTVKRPGHEDVRIEGYYSEEVKGASNEKN